MVGLTEKSRVIVYRTVGPAPRKISKCKFTHDKDHLKAVAQEMSDVDGVSSLCHLRM